MSKSGIYVADVEIIEFLASRDDLRLLDRKLDSTLYVDIAHLAALNFLAFCRVRKLVLDNFLRVRFVGTLETDEPGTQTSIANTLVLSHRTLLSDYERCTVPPATTIDVEEMIVICSDVQAMEDRLNDVEPGHVVEAFSKAPKVVTLNDFIRILVDEGRHHSRTPETQSLRNSADIWARYNRRPKQSEVGYRQIFEPSELEEVKATLSLQPDDIKDLLRRNLTKLQELGSRRRYAPAPTLTALKKLEERFPNFAKVTDRLAREVALAQLSISPIAFSQPILLLGDPGIGKTAFAKALATTFETHFFEIRMNSLTAGFTVGGHDLSWSNGRPGILFNEVALKELINPVALLDEIDKVSADMKYDPMGHFYTLLEPDTARRFRDEAIPLNLDMSHITWIATANNIDELEPPLLSRFSVFEIPTPTPLQSRAIVRNIYQSLLAQATWGWHFAPELSEEVLDTVSGVPPREVRKLLLDALGNAASREDTELCVSHFDDLVRSGSSRARIGFC
jgi:ATP-dependent Lon protease